MKTTDHNARLDAISRTLDILEEGQRRIAKLNERVDRLHLAERADASWRFGGFQPGGAHDGGAKLSPWANTGMDRVEAIIFERGWDRTLPRDRRAALDAAIAADADLAAHLTRDDEIAIVGGGASNPELEDDHADELWRKNPGDAPASATIARGERAGQREREEYSEKAPPLYGDQERLATELAGIGGYGEGVTRAHMLRAIATRRKLDLRRPADYRLALDALHQKVNPTGHLGSALTFDEGLYCLARGAKLNFTEAEASRPQLAVLLAEHAPRLVTDYTAGRDTQRPSPRREPTHEEAADALDREARKLLREQDCAPDERSMERARRHVLATQGKNLSPRYGTN